MLRGRSLIFAMHLSMEVWAVFRSFFNTLQDGSFLENLEDSMKVKLPSRNVAEMSTTSKKRYNENKPYLKKQNYGALACKQQQKQSKLQSVKGHELLYTLCTAGTSQKSSKYGITF